MSDALLATIALKHLHIERLTPCHRDALDFHEVHVTGVRDALQAAYDAGRAAAGTPAPEPAAGVSP